MVAQAAANAIQMAENDDTPGARAALQGKIRSWLNNIARGKTSVPDVHACLSNMPESDAKAWRAGGTPAPGDSE